MGRRIQASRKEECRMKKCGRRNSAQGEWGGHRPLSPASLRGLVPATTAPIKSAAAEQQHQQYDDE
jgi:hypothetical protein